MARSPAGHFQYEGWVLFLKFCESCTRVSNKRCVSYCNKIIQKESIITFFLKMKKKIRF